MFVRDLTSKIYSQRGPKLIGKEMAGPTMNFGFRIALNYAASTLIVASDIDNNEGAIWVYQRNQTNYWQQYRRKIPLHGAERSVRGLDVSDDGKTFIVGVLGPQHSNAGHARVYGLRSQGES